MPFRNLDLSFACNLINMVAVLYGIYYDEYILYPDIIIDLIFH